MQARSITTAHKAESIVRLATGIVAIVFVAATPGCRNNTTGSVAADAAPHMNSAVGPIPGPPQNIVYRKNPYAGNPVAIQEGRKLFLWYNCYGCHGGHAGGGYGA